MLKKRMPVYLAIDWDRIDERLKELTKSRSVWEKRFSFNEYVNMLIRLDLEQKTLK